MNGYDEIERFVAGELSGDVGATPLADDFYAGLRERAAGTRRRPRWLSSLLAAPLRTGSGVVVGSPGVRLLATGVAILALTLALVAGAVVGSELLPAQRTIVVDASGAGDVTTIKEAVALARDGDRVLVRPGIYVEAIAIDADVVLTGDGAVDEIVVMAPDDGPTRRIGRTSQFDPYALLLLDSEATISGLTLSGRRSAIHIDGGAPIVGSLIIDGVGVPWPRDRGFSAIPGAIVITGPSDATVTGNLLRGTGPISINEVARPSVTGNTLTDGAMILVNGAGPGAIIRGNDIEGAHDSGIFVAAQGRITIDGNRISGAGRRAIQVGHHSLAGIEPVIRDNAISASPVGIEVASEAAPRIAANEITGNGIGLLTGSVSEAMVVAGNDLDDNEVGISIGRTGARFEGNTVRRGMTGIVVASGGSPSLIENTVVGTAGEGLLLRPGATPKLEGNVVCGNHMDVVTDQAVGLEPREVATTCEDPTAQ